MIAFALFASPKMLLAAEVARNDLAFGLFGYELEFDAEKRWFALLTVAICGTVIVCTELARHGKPFYVRPIAGLRAMEEAVGRATEMGKPLLYVPGIEDIKEIDTVAGLMILSKVAKIGGRIRYAA